MPSIHFNYGSWEFWSIYDPATGYYGNQKVTFDGPNRLILINSGETNINVAQDIYSNWKEWLSVRDNSKFLPAISVVGGDAITDIVSLGSSFFLENGWRIQPALGNYILVIQGNLYTREAGENPTNPVSGVSVSLTRSNLIDLVVPTLDDTAIDTINSKLDANVIPGIESTNDHARAANLQTQKP